MNYIWVLFLFFSQAAWSDDETQKHMDWTMISFDTVVKNMCKFVEPQYSEKCKTTVGFRILMSRKTLELADVCNAFTIDNPENCSLQTPSQKWITNHIIKVWCERYVSPNPKQCVENFNDVIGFWSFLMEMDVWNRETAVNFRILMSRKTLELADVCNAFTTDNPEKGCPLQTPSQKLVTNRFIQHWCERHVIPNPKQCVENFNDVTGFWEFVRWVLDSGHLNQ